MNINFIERTFASLKHKNFRLFFTGQAISLIGTWLHQTALSWLIYDITGSKFLLGLVAALSTLPMLILSIPGGVIADRYPKRSTILITQSLSMLLAFILAVLVFLKSIEIWQIILIATISGIVFSIDMPVRQTFFADIVGRKDLMNAIALNSSIVNAARIIGPALAGIVMAKFGIAWCFLLNGVSFFAVLLALFKIELTEINIQKKAESIFQYTISGLNYVKQNKFIFNLIILMIVINIFGSSTGILAPAIAKEIFLKGEKGYAMIVSASGLGALIGALFVAYLGNSPIKKNLLNWGIYLFSSMTLLLAFCKIYWLGLIITALIGVGIVTYFSSTTTLIQSNVDDEHRGRVMGIWSLVFGGMVPIGSMFAGICAEHLGISGTLIFSAAVCLLFTISLSIFSPHNTTDQEEEPAKA